MTGVEWKVSSGLVPYPEALAAMEERVAAIRAAAAPEQMWLLEHPPIYTAGTSAKPEDLLDAGQFPVYRTGRGGQYTYHGPGQRVAYLMLDLAKRGGASGPNLRAFVRDLERWLIRTFAHFGVRGFRRQGHVGVWVDLEDGREAKIAAIGLRVKRWVSLHGVSLNVDPDLAHYRGIVACGLREHDTTSLAALGVKVSMDEVDAVLRRKFEEIFGG